MSLEQYRGKWVVLFFYPRDFTFICPTEIKGFAKHADDFAKLNAVVLGASTDSEWSHKAWMERDLPEVAYPIIADTTHNISRDYDVLNDRAQANADCSSSTTPALSVTPWSAAAPSAAA